MQFRLLAGKQIILVKKKNYLIFLANFNNTCSTVVQVRLGKSDFYMLV